MRESELLRDVLELYNKYKDVVDLEARVFSTLRNLRKSDGLEVLSETPDYVSTPAKAFIKQELITYCKREGFTLESAIQFLTSMVPESFKSDNETIPDIVLAWLALQASNLSTLRYINSEELGEFIYDTRFWKLIYISNKPCHLAYKGPFGVPVDVPNGVKVTSFMFCNLKFEEGSYVRYINTEPIIDYHKTFNNCFLPKQFKWSDDLNELFMRNSCSVPFCNCKFEEGFDEDILNTLRKTGSLV